MRSKSFITSMAAAAMTLSAMMPTVAAHAASNNNNTLTQLEQAGKSALTSAAKWIASKAKSSSGRDYQRTSIEVNGNQVSTPYRMVANSTTYMPIYYVDKLLQSLGFTAQWNGTAHTWTLSNGKSAPSLSINGKTGNTTIVVNGNTVEQNVSIIQAKDPASGVVTTFMPIWYVQQILNAMGFGMDSWNGSVNPPTWTLAVNGQVPTAPTAPNVTNGPMAAEVAQGLLSVYATQQVWPWGYDMGLDWQPGYTQVPSSQWYGLSTVFPNQPASAYPQLLGMTNVPQNQPITAGTLAQWLYNWEKFARIPHWEWSTLKNQPSQDPYTLMNDYSMFYGTDFTSANSIVTARDLAAVEQNIKEVDQGYRMLGPDKIQVLVPMIYMGGTATPQKTQKMVQSVDSIIFTFPGHNELVATASSVADQLGVGDVYIPSINSGLVTQIQYSFKSNQPVTLVAALGKSYVVHSGSANLKAMPTVTLMPSYLNDNSPIFEVSIGGRVIAPEYYISFINGKFSRIYVSGSEPTARFSSSWPIAESSGFAG